MRNYYERYRERFGLRGLVFLVGFALVVAAVVLGFSTGFFYDLPEIAADLWNGFAHWMSQILTPKVIAAIAATILLPLLMILIITDR